MHRLRKWLSAAVLGVIALAASPAPSFGRTPTKVEWSSIRVPPGKDADKTARLLKNLLNKAAKKADFGKIKTVKLSARIVDFSSSREGDVQRVTCTIVGRLVGGATAKSKISYGGSPKDRAELEKQVLGMVANGLVARLAQIARAKAARDAEAEAKAKEKAEAEADAEADANADANANANADADANHGQ